MMLLGAESTDSGVSSNYVHSNAKPHEQVSIFDYLGETPSSLKPDFDETINPDTFILVGCGKKGVSAGATCGATYWWSKNCGNEKCMKPFYTINHCNTKPCPVCYPNWLHNRTNRITARLLSKKAKNRNRGKRLVHIVVSWKTIEQYETLPELKMNMRDARRYAARKGFKGGVEYFHAHRMTQEAKDLASASDMGKWEWVRSQSNPSHWYYYSPHVHYQGYVGYMRPPKKNEKFVYKTITNDRNKPINFLKAKNPAAAVAKKAGYLLSHTVFLADNPGGMSSYKWVGNCSYRKFKITPEEAGLSDMEPVACPICGSSVTTPYAARQIYRDMISEGADPPRFAKELELVMQDGIPEDAGMWIQKYAVRNLGDEKE